MEEKDHDELLRSVMAQCSKWVEGEKHVTITINIQNNFWGILKIYTIIWWNESFVVLLQRKRIRCHLRQIIVYGKE